MKFEVTSKHEIGDSVFVKLKGENAKVINVKFSLPAPNVYHIHYLVEFADESRLWFSEDIVSEVRDKFVA